MDHKPTLTFLASLLIFVSALQAQWQERGGTFDLVHLERHQFRLDLLGPGLNYELGLCRNQRVSAALGLSTATYGECYAVGLTLNNRYSYCRNCIRRAGNRRNVSRNSGNYRAAAQSIFCSQLR